MFRNRNLFPSILDNDYPAIIQSLSKLSGQIMEECQKKSNTFEDFRNCAKPRLDRLNNSTVELNTAKLYAEIKYEQCVNSGEKKAECKEKGVDIFMDYLNNYMKRIKKNKPDPEPFIDYDAFNELADQEAEEDEGGDADEDEEEDDE